MGEETIASGPDFWGNLLGLDEPQEEARRKKPPDPVKERQQAEKDARAQQDELRRRRSMYGSQSTQHSGISGLTYTRDTFA